MSCCDFSSVFSIIEKVADPVIRFVGEQCSYALFYKNNVKKLEDRLAELRDKKTTINRRCKIAIRNAEDPLDEVKSWLKNVEDAEQHAKKVVDDFAALANEEHNKWVPKLKRRRSIGSRAVELEQSIRGLIEGSSFEGISLKKDIDFSATLPRDYVRLESRASTLEEMIKALTADDDHVTIGLCGVDGIGKTTLVKQIRKRASEEKRFDEVAMATLPPNCDVNKAQEMLAETLGLKFEEEAVELRASRLSTRLQNSPERTVLIILDDFSEALNLTDIGVPRNEGIKLLLTSRNERVLSAAECKTIFRVDLLEHTEAMELFKGIVGNDGKVQDPEFNSIASQLMEKCKRLPITIATLASTLKDSDLPEWLDALGKLKLNGDAYSNLELSHRYLKEDEAQVLSICTLYGNGGIPTRDLFKYCMGLGLFEDTNSLREARFRLETLIHKLQASLMLLKSTDPNYVEIQNMICDVATKIASKERRYFLANAQSELKEFPEIKLRETAAISFPFVSIDSAPPESLDGFPDLKIFIWLLKRKPTKLLDSFFQGTKELTVLNLSSMYFISLPSSIEDLSNLRTLCLDGCYVKNLSNIGKLRKLQILSFMFSAITQLPKEIAQLSELRLLDLSKCSELVKIEPGVLGRLTRLEELYMEASFDKWEANDATQPCNAKLEELNKMPKLSVLDIHVPDATMLPEDLTFITKLEKFRIHVGGCWDWTGDYKEDRTLMLKADSRRFLLEKRVQAALERSQDLHLDGLNGSPKKSLHQLTVGGFHEIKRLHVQNSPLIQYGVQSVEWIALPTFEKLESLSLKNMDNLEKICHGPPKMPESFRKLKFLRIRGCGMLKNLFPMSMMKGLSRLEEIEINDCKVIQEIVEDDLVEDDEETKNKSNLRKLLLSSLPEFTGFCNSTRNSSEIIPERHCVYFPAIFYGKQVSFPHLESVTLSGLGKLRKIWPSVPHSMEFGNLKSLQLMDCESLLCGINASVLKSLQKMEQLKIERCRSIESVLDLQGLDLASGNVDILPELNELILMDLPNLTSILANNTQRPFSMFKKLQLVRVERCSSLTNLFSLATAQGLGNVQKLTVTECNQMKGIIVADGGEETPSTDTLVLPALRVVQLKTLPVLAAFVCETQLKLSFPSLVLLEISGCKEMKAFSSTKQNDLEASGASESSTLCFFNQKVLLPRIVSLHFQSMGCLGKIWDNELPDDKSFCNLRTVKIEKSNLSSHSLFPAAMVKRLQKLSDIYIEDCNSPTVLFEAGHRQKARTKCEAVMLPELARLSLRRVSNLKFLVEANTNAVVLGIPRLTQVIIMSCKDLIYLFPNATARTLSNLESLAVDICGSIQVVAKEDEEEMLLQAPISFPHLRELALLLLDNLECFSSGGYVFDFPSLEDFTVGGCPRMKTFVQRPQTYGSNSTPIEAVQSLFDDRVDFPNVENLYLDVSTSLQSIWHDQLPSGSFSNLKSLSIGACEKLVTVFPSNGTFGFEKLRSARVIGCPNLKALMPATTAKSLVWLEKLEVNNCKMLETIVVDNSQKSANSGSIFFPRMTSLELKYLPELRSFCPRSNTSQWPYLKCLLVQDCYKVEMFSSRSQIKQLDNDKPKLFSIEQVNPNLETLTLDAEGALMLQDGENSEKIFSNLKTLQLICFHRGLPVFPSMLFLQRFPNMKRLILHCCDYPEIFPEEEALGPLGMVSYETGSSNGAKRLSALENLRELKLYKLFKIQHVWKGNSLVAQVLQRIEILEVHSCPKLVNLFPVASDSFHNLTNLDVSYCESMTHLMTPSAARSLLHLSKMTITSCGNLREVVAAANESGGAETTSSQVCFIVLKELGLHSLPNLASFSPTNCIFSFPCVEKVVVTECPKLQIFSNGAALTPKLKTVGATTDETKDEGRWEGDLNATINKLFQLNNSDRSGIEANQQLA